MKKEEKQYGECCSVQNENQEDSMNKKFLYAITIVVILALGGCGKKESLIKPYDISSQQSEFSFLTTAEEYRATS